jgi:hypothetical protein
MFGVAEVGVGYAVWPLKVPLLGCGVAVGVDVGKGPEDDVALGMPKFWTVELPGIGVGVE